MAETVGLAHGIVVVPLTYEASIYCARCKERYVEHQGSRQEALAWGSPLTTDIETWRKWLASLGWTESGTVCIPCSRQIPARGAASGEQEASGGE